MAAIPCEIQGLPGSGSRPFRFEASESMHDFGGPSSFICFCFCSSVKQVASFITLRKAMGLDLVPYCRCVYIYIYTYLHGLYGELPCGSDCRVRSRIPRSVEDHHFQSRRHLPKQKRFCTSSIPAATTMSSLDFRSCC